MQSFPQPKLKQTLRLQRRSLVSHENYKVANAEAQEPSKREREGLAIQQIVTRQIERNTLSRDELPKHSFNEIKHNV